MGNILSESIPNTVPNPKSNPNNAPNPKSNPNTAPNPKFNPLPLIEEQVLLNSTLISFVSGPKLTFRIFFLT